MKKPPLNKKTIINRRKWLWDKLKEAEMKFKSGMIDLEQRCPHNWVYNIDPSGNNDSSFDCTICGLTCKNKPK